MLKDLPYKFWILVLLQQDFTIQYASFYQLPDLRKRFEGDSSSGSQEIPNDPTGQLQPLDYQKE